MANKAIEKQAASTTRSDVQVMGAALGQHVIQSLGAPNDLHKLDVRHLWNENYRVNVLVGADAASARVAHSFFLVTDGKGNVITSNPQITKLYRDAASNH